MVLSLFILVVIIAFIFGVTNGLTNGGGLVATVITTRAMEPFNALLLVAVCEVVGLFVLGQAVSHVLAHKVLVFPAAATPARMLAVLASAFSAAMIWYIGMWYVSLPTASSHAMVGGMIGAMLMEFGSQAVNWPVLVRIVVFLGIIPVAGVIAGFVLPRATYWLGEFMTPAAKTAFRALEILSLAGVALAQGSNDGQKCVAMILMASAALTGAIPGHSLVMWPVLLLSGLAMAMGVLFGSRRIIGTLGKRLYRVQELQGFCAETATMVLVGFCSHWGYPMSTSQILSTSVLGAGVAVQPRDIRWNLVGDIGLAWLVTIPAAAGLAAALTWVTRYVVS
jgi:PiT family inorganic phosphate transporter